MMVLSLGVAFIIMSGCAGTNGQEPPENCALTVSGHADEAVALDMPLSLASAYDDPTSPTAASPFPTTATPTPADQRPGDDSASAGRSTDWSQFWPSILATAVGALLALLTAMWVERRVAHAEARKALKHHQDRRREIKVAITRDLELNDEILLQILTTVRGPRTAIDVPTLDSWRALHPETIKFFTTMNLAPIYRSLERIARLVDQYVADSHSDLETAVHARTSTVPELEGIVATTRLQITAALSALADEEA